LELNIKAVNSYSVYFLLFTLSQCLAASSRPINHLTKRIMQKKLNFDIYFLIKNSDSS